MSMLDARFGTKGPLTRGSSCIDLSIPAFNMEETKALMEHYHKVSVYPKGTLSSLNRVDVTQTDIGKKFLAASGNPRKMLKLCATEI